MACRTGLRPGGLRPGRPAFAQIGRGQAGQPFTLAGYAQAGRPPPWRASARRASPSLTALCRTGSPPAEFSACTRGAGNAPKGHERPRQPKSTPLDHLIAGYRAFRAGRLQEQRKLYEGLADGQRPETLIVSCCDSRVDPATIFNARPGELFVVRNVANVVPPYEQGGSYHGTSAALEFGVTKLGVSTILILGHGQCGGIGAALAPVDESSPFLAAWIALLRPAVERCKGEGELKKAECERENVRLSVARLMSFPFIAERVRMGTLRLEGAHFAIADGRLEWLEPNGDFRVIS